MRISVPLCSGLARDLCYLSLSLFLTLVAGCGNEGTHREADGAARFSVVTNDSARWSAASAWTLEEDLRLGAGPTGPDVEQFGRIESVAVDSRGRIYVLDGLSQQVRVFDSSGRYHHTIGGEGSGPGEFTAARSLAVGNGDTLWVIDDGEMRYSIFGPDGTLSTTYPRNVRGYLSSAVGALLSDGSFVDWAPRTPDGRFGPRFYYAPLRLAPPEFGPDTLPAIRHTWKMLPSGRLPVRRFGGQVAAAVDRTGSIWFAHTSEYQVYRRSLEGDTTLVFSLDAVAAPLGEAEREYIRESFGRRPDLVSEYLEALPKTKPIIHRLTPDNAGHLLVAADVAGRQPGTIIDVFQDTGVYLGRIVLPSPISLSPVSTPVMHASAKHWYVVTKDDLDIPYLVRFRIQRD